MVFCERHRARFCALTRAVLFDQKMFSEEMQQQEQCQLTNVEFAGRNSLDLAGLL